MSGLRVTVWYEGVHEEENEEVRAVYPDGIGVPIAKYLAAQASIATAQAVKLRTPEQGLPQSLLEETDVLLWWGHKVHDEVDDGLVQRVYERVVNGGMGLVALHSAHMSKIFCKLMGTPCDLKWRDDGEWEKLWLVDPAHPIAEGIPDCIELDQTEMYGEHFNIPQPDQLVFISSFEGGEVFRSGCCWHRGRGKVFYFRPGHETFPIYYNETVLKVIYNGTRWAAPNGGPVPTRGNIPRA